LDAEPLLPAHLQYPLPSRNDVLSPPVSNGLGVATGSRFGSPGVAGDDGEDDGMGMENFKDLMVPEPLEPGRNTGDESSFVESAEKRDKVSMTFEHGNDFEYSRDADSKASGVSSRFGKRRKSAKGNYLRVRSNSYAKSSIIPGAGTLSGVSNAINDPSE